MKQTIKLNRRRVIVEKFKTAQEAWFKSILNNLTHKIIYKKKFLNYVFFFKDNECFFEYNQENLDFFYDCDKVLLVCRIKYNMNHQQIQEIIKSIAEDYFKLRGLTPRHLSIVRYGHYK